MKGFKVDLSLSGKLITKYSFLKSLLIKKYSSILLKSKDSKTLNSNYFTSISIFGM